MDTYEVVLVAIGVAVLAASVLPRLLATFPLSFPMVYVAFGMALFALPLGLEPPDPVAHPVLTEHLAETVVIVSLMGVGLQIDRRVGWRRWRTTWRLLAIAMPLMIALAAVVGWWAGLVPAAALLLGAVVAPTDPVLANDVQVDAPGEGGEDEVRFALTSEAGLNDALGFPFTYAAIAAALAATTGAGLSSWVGTWFLEDLVLKIVVGLALGVLGGWLAGSFLFRFPHESRPARSAEGFVALGVTLSVYGVTELAHGYGFLAVFVAAVTVRMRERSSDFHAVLHRFVENGERVLSALLLVLLGGAVVGGILAPLGWSGAAVGLALVLVVRPLTAGISLWRSRLPRSHRWAIAFFGIRGMGSIYYLAFAATRAPFPGMDRIWAIATFVVLLSVVIHGATATPVMNHIDRRERARARRAGLPHPDADADADADDAIGDEEPPDDGLVDRAPLDETVTDGRDGRGAPVASGCDLAGEPELSPPGAAPARIADDRSG